MRGVSEWPGKPISISWPTPQSIARKFRTNQKTEWYPMTDSLQAKKCLTCLHRRSQISHWSRWRSLNHFLLCGTREKRTSIGSVLQHPAVISGRFNGSRGRSRGGCWMSRPRSSLALHFRPQSIRLRVTQYFIEARPNNQRYAHDTYLLPYDVD